MIKYSKFRLRPKLQEAVRGESVLELGAGIFRLFDSYDAPLKVGIELIDAYVDQRQCSKDVIALRGDIFNFENVLAAANLFGHYDIVCLIDIVEHLDKQAALDLIERIKTMSNRIVLFTPLGFEEQHGHEHVDFGVGIRLSAEQRDNAIAAQKHKSGWEPEELAELGFEVTVDRTYHRPNLGAMFAVWSNYEK